MKNTRLQEERQIEHLLLPELKHTTKKQRNQLRETKQLEMQKTSI
jgi:hypothetical protein